MKTAHWIILLAGVVMFLAGVAHGVGYTFVVPMLAKYNLPANLMGAIKGLWLVYSAHLILLSVAVFWISRLPGARSLLLWLVLIPAVDTVAFYHFVGFFLGFYMVATVTVLLAIGAWLLPRAGNQPAH